MTEYDCMKSLTVTQNLVGIGFGADTPQFLLSQQILLFTLIVISYSLTGENPIFRWHLAHCKCNVYNTNS